jgi:hypothetical protein
VYRLFAVILATAVFALACGGGAPATSPGGGGATGSPPIGDAALEELCGTGDASLTSIAGELDALDAQDTDTSALEASIGELMTNLEGLDAATGSTAARDAAVVALTQVQNTISDPAQREQLASQAAEALRTLETEICP